MDCNNEQIYKIPSKIEWVVFLYFIISVFLTYYLL